MGDSLYKFQFGFSQMHIYDLSLAQYKAFVFNILVELAMGPSKPIGR